METISLNGAWRLAWTESEGRRPDKSGRWIEAQVPGEVHIDLHRAGVIPDPYMGTNFKKCLWTEQSDFWYRTTFPGKPSWRGQSARLRFEGLDNFATIWLNGEEIGRSHNMFYAHEFEATGKLRTGEGEENELVIRLAGPISHVNRRNFPGLPHDVSTIHSIFNMPWRHFTRKMQMSYGWDNVPRMVTIGIFRPVSLIVYDKARLSDVHVVSQLGLEHIAPGDSVSAWLRLAVCAETAATAGGSLSARIVIADAEGAKTAAGELQLHCDTVSGTSIAGAERATRAYSGELSVELAQARLWWPHELGEPHLYGIHVQLLDAAGELLDERTISFGIRDIRLVTEPAELRKATYRIGPNKQRAGLEMDGGYAGPWDKVPLQEPETVTVRPFRFTVNGVPLFIKGVNWQPADNLLPLVTDEKYTELTLRAREAGFNLIRVWGGGLPEDDRFYDACDRLGLLVWQDFFFACALYPQEDWFAEEIEHEARAVVQRLRNRTCIALWCGDNEGDMMNANQGKVPEEANRLTHVVIKNVLAEMDNTRFYHPSSPSGGSYPRSPWEGDKRNWGAFYPQNFYEHIRGDEGRFVSEGGSYSLPGMKTIELSIPENERWPVEESESWYYHLGNVPGWQRGFEKQLRRYVSGYFGDPDNLEEYVWLSQMAQACGYKAFIEHYRTRKPECGGYAIWKYADTWPSGEMSMVDYAMENKISYYYAKRANLPLQIVMKYAEDRFDVYVINDKAEPWSGEAVVCAVGFDGSRSELLRLPVKAGRDEALLAGAVSLERLAGFDPLRTVLQGQLLSAGGVPEASGIQLMTDRFKLLQTGKARADVRIDPHGPFGVEPSAVAREGTVAQEERSFAVEVRALTFVRDVQVVAPETDPLRVRYSDNHFPLLPGEKAVVIVTGPAGMNEPNVVCR